MERGYQGRFEPKSINIAQLSNIWKLRVACFFQVFGFGILWSFSSIWMKEHGIGETLIGLISSTHIATGFVFGLLWGRFSDQSGRPDRIVMIGSVGVCLGMALLAFCYTPIHFFSWALLIGVFLPMILTQMPLLAVSAIDASESGKGYASYRIFGSIGYVLGTLIMPRIVSDIYALFIVASISLCLSVVPIAFVRISQRLEKERGSFSEAIGNRSLLNFLVAVFFFALAMPAIFNFTWVFARGLGADNSLIGLLGAVQGGVALVALPITGRGVDRIGARWILLFAFVAMPMRAFSLIFVESPVWLLAPISFHFFTWAGFEVAGVLFVSRLADSRNRGLAQAMFVSAQVLGNLVGSPILGYLAEEFGYSFMYCVSSLMALVGLILFLRQHWFLSTHNKSIE